MKAGTRYIVLMIILVLCAHPRDAHTQAYLSEEDFALFMTGSISILGCGLFSLINTIDLIGDDSNKWSGGFGTFFGVTLIGTIVIANSQSDVKINEVGSLLSGSIALTSITLGVWSIIMASRKDFQAESGHFSFSPMLLHSSSESSIGARLEMNW